MTSVKIGVSTNRTSRLYAAGGHDACGVLAACQALDLGKSGCAGTVSSRGCLAGPPF